MKGISKGWRPGRALFVPALLASTALTGVSVPAVAQETTAGIDIVTVTAQKREQNLQIVPVSVQVLGETRLSELHVVSADDYIKYLPSVASQSIAPGFTVVHMRGVASGENNNHSGPLPTVGTYLDEQPITTIYGILDIPIIDVARIEALQAAHGIGDTAIRIRITGCPDGCARPYLAEVGLVGKAPGRYNLHLGADVSGTRLNVRHLENADEARILATLDGLFSRYAGGRATSEPFGDWLVRAKAFCASYCEAFCKVRRQTRPGRVTFVTS